MSTERSAAVLLTKQSFTAQATNGAINLTNCGQYAHLLVLINLTALGGTTPQITFDLQLLDDYGNAYNVWSQADTAAAVHVHGLGPGSDSPAPFGDKVTLAYDLTGTSPTATFTVCVYGKVAG